MFITNRVARAGATRSGPGRLPHARVTTVAVTRITAPRLTQNAASSGNRNTDPGIARTAMTRASRQFEKC